MLYQLYHDHSELFLTRLAVFEGGLRMIIHSIIDVASDKLNLQIEC